ncbi:hypothetical protein REPUB_Repub12eG0019900 [Reevesia pubescens]
MAKTDMAVASAATLVAAQCVEAAEAMGAEREHLASMINSAVKVWSAGDIMTLTAGAATALREVATLKARALKEVWNIAAVIPMDKGGGNGSNGSSKGSFSGELDLEENFLGICSRELLARGCELLKRTRKGDLHWKVVSVYINTMNQVMLKMKSRHVAGTFIKKKECSLGVASKTSDATPNDLFEDVAEELLKQYHDDKVRVNDAVKLRKIYLASIWTLEDLRAAIVEDISSLSISNVNLKLVFEELLEKVREKEEK